MGRPYQTELNMTIAGAAVGAALGLPEGPLYAVLGAVIGALIPVPSLMLFAVVVGGFLQLFNKSDENEPEGSNTSEGKSAGDSKEDIHS